MNKINILIIGNDGSLVDKSSDSYKRASLYSNLVEKYDVVTFAKENATVDINNNSSIIGVKVTIKLLAYFKLWKVVFALGKRNKYEIVSAQDPFEYGLLAYLFSKIHGCKLHIQEHGDFFGKGSRSWMKENWINCFRYFLGLIILNRADGIRVVSNRIKRSLIDRGISGDRISVVPIVEGFNHNNHDKCINEELRMVFVGRMVKAKNIPMILKALKIYFKRNSGQFYFVGDGEMKEYISDFIKENPLADKINLVGWVSDLEDFYKNMDILVLTSWHEGWGRVVVDAGSYGVVPIMTNVGCAGELIEHNKNGLIVDFNDHEQLAERLAYFNKNREELARLSKNVKKDTNDYCSNFDLYKSMLNSWNTTLNID